MRRTLAVVLSAGVVWLFLGFSVKAQLGLDVATENGDVNGDDEINVSDPVYLLNWLFGDGPAPVPVACADPVDLVARVSALEEVHAAQEFGRRVAGTYFVTFGTPRGPLKGLLTVVSDGSVLLSPQSQYGHVFPSAFQSIWQGRWTRTDDAQLTVDTFFLTYGDGGIPPAESGADFVRYTWIWDVQDNFSGLSGATVSTAGWSPELDPVVDSPDLNNPPRFTMTARRL